MKRGQKAGFVVLEKLENHTNQGKGKEKKQAIVTLIACIVATLEMSSFWLKKKTCLTEYSILQ